MAISNQTDRHLFAERISRLVHEYESTSNLARLAGVSESVVRKWKLAQSEPSRPHLLAIARATDVTLPWLMAGEGVMRQAQNQIEENYPAYRLQEDFTVIPFYETVADYDATSKDTLASAQIAFGQDWLQRQGHHTDELAALQVQGDAMADTICDGDLILINTKQCRLIDSAVYALCLGDYFFARRLQCLHDGSARIVNDNRIYPDEQISREKLDSLNIIGRVIWRLGKL